MIGNHVAESASLIVVSAARTDAQSFGGGDLQVIDIAAVPDRFEDAVGKAEDDDVLNRLFAEIMIDAINLTFVERLFQRGVESASRLEIMAERFLDNDATPVISGFLNQSGVSELMNNFREKIWSDREMVEVVALSAVHLVRLGDLLFDLLVRFRILAIATHVVDALLKPF